MSTIQQAASDTLGLSVQTQASLSDIQAILNSQSMTITETVLLGIVSSLVATVVFIFSSWLVKAKLLPWYADKIYRGVRIDGEWECNSIDGLKIDDIDEISSSLHIVQSGDEIRGTYSHTTSNGTASYALSGNIKDAYVTVTTWPIARNQLDAGAMVLRIFSKNELRMKGKFAFPSAETGQVKVMDVEFHQN